MIIYAVVCFLVAALGGVFMAVQVFTGKSPATPIAAAHGLLGAAGLVLLLWLVLVSGAPAAVVVGLALLVIAALGGFFLLSFHVRGIPHPKAVVIVHACAAVIGVGALIVSLL